MPRDLTFHAPGIYLGLPFEEYLSDPALSNSGIQNLRVSPLTYWVNSPLNPESEPDETEAKETGRAFHKRILEGSEAFAAAYAPELLPSDYPDALKSGEQLRKHCELLGLSKSGTLAEMTARIRAVDHRVPLWLEIEQAYLKTHEGKEFLSAALIRRIELAAGAIEANPDTAKLFRDGFPEVSIFWIDPATGVRMKARLDYLTMAIIPDLKTFSNSQGFPLHEAVGRAIAFNGYGIQAVCYLDAVRHAKRMVREQGMEAVHLGGSLATTPFDFADWFKRFAAAGDHDFVFVFQESGRVPNVALRKFSRNINFFDIVTFQYEAGVRFYKDCLDRWGYDQPWAEPAALLELEDEDLPLKAFS